MTEINRKILDLISKKASANEIASITGLSNKQLLYRLRLLKSKGYDFFKKYYSDGEIVYVLNQNAQKQKDVTLITSPHDEREIKIVIISDLHLGNAYERPDLLKRVYELCAKEGIHIIINGGDIIDGVIGCRKYKKIIDPEKQIEHALNVYPYDKNIINFVCLGNHDYSILEHCGYNLESVLEEKRHDIVSLGYGIGNLKIKNDKIIVRHQHTPTACPIDTINSGLMITGHTHKAHDTVNGNLINIYPSTLSDMAILNASLPGFTKARISFNMGVFSHGVFEHYVFLDQMYKVRESHYNLMYTGKRGSSRTLNEEIRIPYREEKSLKLN